jgi:hypothetical protein
MNGLTWAMGDADFKPNEFFDKEKHYSVCSNTYFNNNKAYELTLSL